MSVVFKSVPNLLKAVDYVSLLYGWNKKTRKDKDMTPKDKRWDLTLQFNSPTLVSYMQQSILSVFKAGREVQSKWTQVCQFFGTIPTKEYTD